MENFKIILIVILICIAIIRIIIYIRRKVKQKCRLELIATVTPLNRGTSSERDLVYRLLKSGISATTIFHDLLFKKLNEEFTQVDVVVPTKVGILVFEVKDYNGWIFGNGGHDQWTQVMAYGKEKYRFYNPIRQNASHIRYLRNNLKLTNNIPVFSIIVFYGNCTLKEINYIPRNTYIIKPHRLNDVLTNIFNNSPEVIFNDKWEIVRILKEAVERGNLTENMHRHIDDIENRVGKHRIYE